jgi:hypothetical protein
VPVALERSAEALDLGRLARAVETFEAHEHPAH